MSNVIGMGGLPGFPPPIPAPGNGHRGNGGGDPFYGLQVSDVPPGASLLFGVAPVLFKPTSNGDMNAMNLALGRLATFLANMRMDTGSLLIDMGMSMQIENDRVQEAEAEKARQDEENAKKAAEEASKNGWLSAGMNIMGVLLGAVVIAASGGILAAPVTAALTGMGGLMATLDVTYMGMQESYANNTKQVVGADGRVEEVPAGEEPPGIRLADGIAAIFQGSRDRGEIVIKQGDKYLDGAGNEIPKPTDPTVRVMTAAEYQEEMRTTTLLVTLILMIAVAGAAKAASSGAGAAASGGAGAAGGSGVSGAAGQTASTGARATGAVSRAALVTQAVAQVMQLGAEAGASIISIIRSRLMAQQAELQQSVEHTRAHAEMLQSLNDLLMMFTQKSGSRMIEQELKQLGSTYSGLSNTFQAQVHMLKGMLNNFI